MDRMTLAASGVAAIVLGAAVNVAVATASPSPAPAHTVAYTADDLRCLALTVYWEARSEPDVGQRAVAHTVLNRVRSPSFPDTVCGVVHQGGEAPLGKCQFSWWCDGLNDDPADTASWSVARQAARDALEGRGLDPTNGAVYYHARAVTPEWSKTFLVVADLGNHLFYAADPAESVQ